MSKHYSFKHDERDQMIHRFGQSFYEKILEDVAVYADKWTLTSFQLIPSYSANVVFRCHSAAFGSAVLKIGNPSTREIQTEFHTLREYNGGRFCRVFEADLTSGIILEERIQPGRPLRDEESLETRLAVFCSLYRDLHIAPARADVYPTYPGWVARITEYMNKRPDCKELYEHMRNAREICASVLAAYSSRMLLHGDLHHDNILLGEFGGYRIIDPKGVIGDPVFDVPRFILNEFGDELTAGLYQQINDIICILAENLHIPSDIIKQCLYVETAMAVCWNVEDGAGPEEFPKLLERMVFVERILAS